MPRRLATFLAVLITISAGVALALPAGAAANGCPLRTTQGTAGTAEDPIRIDSVADLQMLSDRGSCYLSGYVFRQTADIDLTGTAWTPIGTNGSAFTGTYDGNGHVIRGLTTTAANLAGLFGVAANATLRRLTLTGAQVTASSTHAGVLAGRVEASSVEDVHVRSSTVAALGVAAGDGSSGGLVGQMSSSTLSNVSVEATVNVAGVWAGGLVGVVLDSTVVDATASGAVSAAGGYAGGLMGLACGSQLTRTSASGTVNGGAGTGGGLVGTAGDVCVGSFTPSGSAPTITDSQATGAVTGLGPVGGFAGSLSGISIVRSYATGAVAASGGQAGGFVGTVTFSTITDAYARGAVSSPAGNSAAGFAAGATLVTITRVYATGLVSGTDVAGGLIEGYAPTICSTGQIHVTCISETSVSGSFWDTQTTRQASSLYGTGQTTAGLQAIGTYTAAGWPIASGWTDSASATWGICAGANGGYPYLLRQYTTTTEPCTVVPSAPLDPLATSQNERLLVTWKAPASDGGSAITSYTATAKPGGRSCTVAAPKLQCLITGLANGTSYVVSITAANKRGDGAIAKAARVAAAPPLGVPRVTQDGSTIITQIAVNGPGTVSQVGALDATGEARRLVRGLRPLCRASKAPKKAGTVTLRCAIDTSLLAAGSRRVRLTTQFKAKGGGIFTRRQTFVVRGTGTGTARPSNVTG